jgi:hypothetical protein
MNMEIQAARGEQALRAARFFGSIAERPLHHKGCKQSKPAAKSLFMRILRLN